MNYSDPMVTNGIIYAPIKDIIMSDEPVYGTQPYAYRPMYSPLYKTDKFDKQTKKSGDWRKWLFWIGAAALTALGLKKYGIHPIRNFLNKHPKIANIGTSISNGFNTCVDFCKRHIPFIKKKP